MSEIRAAAIQVELKLASYSKTHRGGVSVRFTVHPQDAHKLHHAEIGDRYTAVLVQLDEHEEPIAPPPTPPPDHDLVLLPPNGAPSTVMTVDAPTESPAPDHSKRLVTRAVMMCKDPRFWNYLQTRWAMHDCINEEQAIKGLRLLCGIKSRSELLLDTPAATRFDKMLTDFAIWSAAQ